jgi:acetyltransferase-like isoleucine patch superfamily enzyme
MKTYGGHYLLSAELRQLGCRSVGEDVQVHSSCVLVGMENLSIGSHVRVDAFCSLIVGDGWIKIGDYVHIASYSFLSGGEGIELCDFAGLSHGVRLYSRNEDYTGLALTNPTIPEAFLKLQKGRVTLGRHVIVGCGSIVLPGVEIAEGSSVGALSLVKSSLAPWGIYAGIPARRLRDRARTLLQFEPRLEAADNQASRQQISPPKA